MISVTKGLWEDFFPAYGKCIIDFPNVWNSWGQKRGPIVEYQGQHLNKLYE
jgi:hypothetical protein